jgi:small subunit ribosomal protein S7
MSRRSQAPKRDLLPDPKHGSQRLTKFINMMMEDGKNSVAERIIYHALDQVVEKKGGKHQIFQKQTHFQIHL